MSISKLHVHVWFWATAYNIAHVLVVEVTSIAGQNKLLISLKCITSRHVFFLLVALEIRLYRASKRFGHCVEGKLRNLRTSIKTFLTV